MTVKEVSEEIRCVGRARRRDITQKPVLAPEVGRALPPEEGIRDYQPDDLGWLELALCMRSAGRPGQRHS